METTENNKLIAEFMGGKLVDKLYPNVFRIQFPAKETLILPQDLKYNTDWNWLMEVVDKIELLGYWTETMSGLSQVFSVGRVNEVTPLIFSDGNVRGKINHVYNGVIQFIKWYNKNTL